VAQTTSKSGKSSSSKGSKGYYDLYEDLSIEDKPIEVNPVNATPAKTTEEEAADVKPNSDRVRDSCLKAFELGFPDQGWASESSLEDFAANMAPSAFFASPMGGGEGAEMQGFAEGDLMAWFKESLNPNVLRFTEIRTSEVAVANNVCSFDKIFFAV
ncbi:hypothetical protein ACHAWF_000128, partial [Thalassiosira exigua]